MGKKGIVLGHQPVEPFLQIMPRRGIRIFLNGKARRRVLHQKRAKSVFDSGPRDDLSETVGEFKESLSRRAHFDLRHHTALKRIVRADRGPVQPVAIRTPLQVVDIVKWFSHILHRIRETSVHDHSGFLDGRRGKLLSMSTVISVTLGVLGVCLGGLSFSTLIGLGIHREGLPWAITVAAVLISTLPVIGIAGLFRFRPEGWAIGLSLWPFAVLTGVPLYFPGERANALTTGVAFLASSWGEERVEHWAQFGERAGALMGPEFLAGRPPAPATLPVNERADNREEFFTPSIGGDIALPYEGAGRSLRVPVSFDGAHTEDLWMLFDTGATYTTLNPAALAALGVPVPEDSPVVTLSTANGEIEAPVVMIERLWLAGLPVEGVTIAVCETCASDQVEGMLGLNVSQQFAVTVDPGRRLLLLDPLDDPDRQTDIAHWVEISATATVWSDRRVVVEIDAKSRSPRPILSLRVAVQCTDAIFQAEIFDLTPYGSTSERLSLPRGTNCDRYNISLDEARW